MGRNPEISVRRRPNKNGARIQFRFRGTAWTLPGDASEWSEVRIEQERQRELARILLGTWDPPQRRPNRGPASVPTVKEACEDYAGWIEDSNRRPKTKAEIRRRLEHVISVDELANCPIDVLDAKLIERYQRRKREEREDRQRLHALRRSGVSLTADELQRMPKSYDRGLSDDQINRTVEELSRVIRREMEADQTLAASMGNVNPAKLKRLHLDAEEPTRFALTPVQAKALLEGAEALERRCATDPLRAHVPFRLIIWLLLVTGLRISELTALRRQDVSLESGFVEVGRGKTNAATRRIPLADSIASELRTWMGSAPDASPDAPLFPNRKGKPMDRLRVGDRVLRPALAEAAALQQERSGDSMPDGLLPHDCRRTFATFAYQRRPSMPVAWVMNAMGHRSAALALEIYQGVQGLRPTAEEETILHWLTAGW